MAEVFDLQFKQGIAGVNIKGSVTCAPRLLIYELNGKINGFLVEGFIVKS
jgi:hypothetical protein